MSHDSCGMIMRIHVCLPEVVSCWGLPGRFRIGWGFSGRDIVLFIVIIYLFILGFSEIFAFFNSHRISWALIADLRHEILARKFMSGASWPSYPQFETSWTYSCILRVFYCQTELKIPTWPLEHQRVSPHLQFFLRHPFLYFNPTFSQWLKNKRLEI